MINCIYFYCNRLIYSSKFKFAHIRLFSSYSSLTMNVKYLGQEEAIKLDQDLFNECKFSVDQLMELAGLSVAIAVNKTYPLNCYPTIAICCGPGNNGGDGLVAARHLHAFGYKSAVYYPKAGKSELFFRLVKQCNDNDIKFLPSIGDLGQYSLIVDAIFGFSYKPPLRSEYFDLLNYLSQKGENLVSIDIPSGWDVEKGPPQDSSTPILSPDCLVSLTAPKLCAKHFKGRHHWLGGRFVPKNIICRYSLNLPQYQGSEQCVKLS